MVQRKGVVSMCYLKQPRKATQVMLDLTPKRKVVCLLDLYGQKDSLCEDSEAGKQLGIFRELQLI